MRDHVCIIIPTRDPLRARVLVQQCTAHGWSDCVVVHPGASIQLDGAVSIGTEVLLSPAAARNCGARATQKPFLCFLDDDVILHGDAITRLVAFCMAEMHVAVGPLLADRPTDGYWRRCMHRVMAEGQFVESCTAEPLALMSMLLVVRRDAFWSAGGFDEAYADPAGEDTALTMRMATYGTLGVDRSTSIYHDPHPDGCWPASRRLWRYGSAWALLSRTHQSRTTQIQHLPRPLRYLCIAVVPLLAGIDALRHSSVTYWPGYTWLRICWYVGVLTTPPLDRVTP